MSWAVYNAQTLKVYETTFTKVNAKILLEKWKQWERRRYHQKSKSDLTLIKTDKLKAWLILKGPA